ncbi:MAG: hypothetical protein O7G85_15915 [Planctomycetota bacterium]|nr:hypothetical protein [Planctomycetota bacterium]
MGSLLYVCAHEYWARQDRNDTAEARNLMAQARSEFLKSTPLVSATQSWIDDYDQTPG